MLWNEFYDDDKAMILDLCDIMNAEFRDMAAAGCPLIQVEEPPHHGRAHAARHARMPISSSSPRPSIASSPA